VEQLAKLLVAIAVNVNYTRTCN